MIRKGEWNVIALITYLWIRLISKPTVEKPTVKEVRRDEGGTRKSGGERRLLFLSKNASQLRLNEFVLHFISFNCHNGKLFPVFWCQDFVSHHLRDTSASNMTHQIPYCHTAPMKADNFIITFRTFTEAVFSSALHLWPNNLFCQRQFLMAICFYWTLLIRHILW